MEDKRREDHLHAVGFAAGMAALMACLECAAVVSIVEKWRVRVFLALNLLLLAILFTSSTTTTSTKPSPPNEVVGDVEENTSSNVKSKIIVKRRKCTPLVAADNESGLGDASSLLSFKRADEKDREIEENDEDEGGIASGKSSLMSKEELNERAEAFIAKFRQQYLVSA
ncbi:hypothetical protein RJ640_029853 [Escallonia rubra]|uniref:Uncharacterized protein n=1 Tax=Escallonia rubra TaxID=112253 RepID=A0AA88U1M4_9ASTE|nr:hypothetical protein RJ640_029853 [Escallonia rubra]